MYMSCRITFKGRCTVDSLIHRSVKSLVKCSGLISLMAVLSPLQNCDALWEDFHQKLVDSTINNLETYLSQFPDLKVPMSFYAC